LQAIAILLLTIRCSIVLAEFAVMCGIEHSEFTLNFREQLSFSGAGGKAKAKNPLRGLKL
jgi:hypothetical protein